MADSDDFTRLRYRRAASRRDAASRGAGGGAAFVGQVFAAHSVPTTTGCFYSVHPVSVLGSEAEGGAGSLAVDATATVLVYVAGGRPPVAGDKLLCRFISHRWVADPLKDLGGGITVSGCDCTNFPGGAAAATSGQLTALAMTSSNHTGNNGMFQDDTFTYIVWPTGYAGGTPGVPAYHAGGYAFLSDHSFTDGFGGTFRYYFYCQRSQFFLTRVYLSSIFGSPYEDSVRYAWTTGTYGNSCSPLALTNGRIFAGGDTSCIVTVTG